MGASVFYNTPPESESGKSITDKSNGDDETKSKDDEVEKLDAELNEAKQTVNEAVEADKQLSSHVWICTSTHAISKVTVIDANSPADVLESFHVCSSHLLCIASVPGAKESDYKVDEELNRLVVEESRQRDEDAATERLVADGVAPESVPGGGGIGSISFVSCATGNEFESLEAEKEEEEKGRL